MSFPGDSETALILALQEEAVNGAGWMNFLASLSRLTGAAIAAIVERGPDREPKVSAAGPVRVHVDDKAASMSGILIDRIRPERIYDEAELAELAGSVAVQTALDDLGMGAVRAIRVTLTDSSSLVLGILSRTGFAAAETAVLRRLFPFLQAAARTASRMHRERLCASLTADAAHRASLGWFLLDAKGLVVETSTPDRSLPAGLRMVDSPQGNWLALADRTAEAALATVLQQCAQQAHPGAWAVRVAPGLHLRIRPCRDLPPAIALATLHGIHRLVPDAASLMVDLFGLLPSEARLAAAIASGHGIVEAAKAVGLSIETARGYSKKIFAKTGTQGQADLVRLIYASGLAQSPPQP